MRDRKPRMILSRLATPVNLSTRGIDWLPTSGHQCCGTGHDL